MTVSGSDARQLRRGVIPAKSTSGWSSSRTRSNSLAASARANSAPRLAVSGIRSDGRRAGTARVNRSG